MGFDRGGTYGQSAGDLRRWTLSDSNMLSASAVQTCSLNRAWLSGSMKTPAFNPMNSGRL